MTFAELQTSFLSFVMTNLPWFLVPLVPALGIYSWTSIRQLFR